MNSIVIARYNESLDWIVQIPPEFEIFVYNKGDKIIGQHILQKAHHIIERPNAGRESETYLYHMLTNLKSGNDFTVFAQGDPFEHSPDFIAILARWQEWDDLQPMTWQWRPDSGVPTRYILDDYAKKLQGHLRIRPERFSLATWAPNGFFDTGAFGTSRDYRRIHGELPEGINIAAHFFRLARLHSLAEKAEAGVFGVFCYGAIFAVRNDLVRQVPTESLQLLQSAANGAMTYGYVLERIWLHLFGADFETTAPVRARGQEQPVRREAPVIAADYQAKQLPVAPQAHGLAAAPESRPQAASQASTETASAAQGVRASARPKRLFISTGYFATAVAAAIGAQRASDSEDHLLIVNDRQDADRNRRWAYHMFDRWNSVQIATHEQYYGDRTNFRSPFAVEFDEVYSSHLTMASFVREKFPAEQHFFFEEGLTSYAHAKEFGGEDTRFYALSPKLLRNSPVISSPVDADVLRHKFAMSVNCYQVPVFDHPRNVILLAAGLPPKLAGSELDSLTACEPAAKALIAAGFKVWLRPHPRVDVSSAFERSTLAAIGVQLLETDLPLIEPLILRNRDKVSAVVSVYSSYLVHSYSLFGVPAFSLSGQMPDEQQTKWKETQDSIVPDVQHLLQANPHGILDVATAFHNSAIGNGQFNQRWVSG